MARGDKILTLTPEQHKLLGHALALAHAVHSQMGGNGLGVAPGELPAIYDDVDIFVQPGAHGGRGFFSTLGAGAGARAEARRPVKNVLCLLIKPHFHLSK